MSKTDQAQTVYHHYLAGGGEMGALTCAYDWASTPLGPPETWSQNLLTTVSILLNSKFPMFLWWGKDLIQFYNDAYRPSLGNDGKHPVALGQRAEECWPEIWSVIKPLIDQVLSGGEATWSEDQLIPIYRNNKLEDVYWTFSYSRVNDQHGHPGGVLVTCNETTKYVQAYQDIERTKDELEFVIEAAELGTWDLNPFTGNFTCNDRLKDWFGLSPDLEIELPKAIDVIAEYDRTRVLAAIAQAMTYESGGNYEIEYTVINPINPTPRHVKAKGKALFNNVKEVTRFSGTLHDITQQKKDEERKNDFIAMVSHELKTPLTSLKAYVQMVLARSSKNADDLSSELLGKVDTQIRKMTEMINGFLNISRLDTGKIYLDKRNFILNELVKETMENFMLTISTHQLFFVPAETLSVYADYEKIGHVLNNLLSNAVKYSPKGKLVKITCHQADDMAIVTVKDEGMGVKPQDIDKLFERFYRVESKHTQAISGFGIGLYLCSEIIQIHQGKIWIESENGVGSTFYFSLPLTKKLPVDEQRV